jgi:ADP-heptose:LPS heptosyltransferase
MGVMAPAVESPGSVLVYVGLDLVGDGLIKLPFARALRNAFPSAHITWLAGKGKSVYARGLAPLVSGLIDDVTEDAGVGRNWLEALTSPLRGTALEGRRFDLIIDSQRRLKTTLLLKRIPHRTFVSGAAGYRFSDLKPARPSEKPPAMVRQLLDLVELASGRPADVTALPFGDPSLDDLAAGLLPAGRCYVGLAPGAGGRHKCWPLERYLELAEIQLAAGRTPVMLLGPEEIGWVNEVAKKVPAALLPLQSEAVARAGPSPLVTIALARRLAAAVANDAGVGHMLAAADCPLVSLFGPTPPEKFAPLVSRARVLRAQDHGGEDISCIPLAAVEVAVDALLEGAEETMATRQRPGGGESRRFGGEAR